MLDKYAFIFFTEAINMKKVPFIFLFALVFSCVGQAANNKIETVYTDLTVEKCKTIESSDEGTGSYRGVCPGIGGYKLELLEGDIRQSINVIAPNGNKSELEFWTNVSGAFSAVGEKAEWRVIKTGENVNPLALIIRYNTNEDPENPEKLTSRLIVIKIINDRACITDIVEPIKNANIKARELADASGDKPCKFETGSVVEGKPDVIIADFADYEKGNAPIWKKFASEDELEKAREKNESYTIAYIWTKGDGIAQVNFTHFSPSGDWAEYYFHTYREDGSLSTVNRELRTFMDDIIVNRIQTYDENGKLLQETKTFRDLNTQKPIPAKEYIDMEAGRVYLKTADLPFFSMLSAKPKNGSAAAGAEKDFIPAGWKLETITTGDLNGDSMPDSALQIIKEDAEEDDYDRTLILLFKTTDGKLAKATEAGKIIRCSICGGILGGGPADIKIEKGVLLVSQMYGSRQATNYLHRFRYEPSIGKFRLIGEDVTNYDRATGESETKSTNFLTGKQILTKEKYDEKTGKEAVVSRKTKKIAVTKKYIEQIDSSDY